MSMKEDYAQYLVRHEAIRPTSHQLAQDRRYVHPFRLYGPIWYVGDDWVCVHLIDTGDGLLLLDCGNCGAEAMLVNAIWEAGFRPADVKWIILSHGHYDHIGAAQFFRRMFGTKIYLGAPDAKMFRERPWLSLIQTTKNDADGVFEPDVEINDGDELTFGSIKLRCVLCPGHTEGVVSLFFDADGPEGVKHVGFYGGFGFNTMQKDFLLEFGDPDFKMRQVYLDSLAKVREEPVDIMLGNHGYNNDTLGRMKKLLADPDGPNPFVEPGYWKSYLDKRRDDLLALMAKPENN